MTSFSPRSWLKAWRSASRSARGRTRRTAARLHLEPLEDRQLLAVFTVTNANNSGAGSLRQAILSANSTLTPDTIRFSVGQGPKTIAPTSRLPEITNPVVLDGTTQPGYVGTPLITIRGHLAGPFAEGLVLRTYGSQVIGLTIRSFNGHGIVLYSNGNTIGRCYIGIDPFQTFGAGNRDAGVAIEGSHNRLFGNVISGNGLSGVIISGTGARNNRVAGVDSLGGPVAGNYIGTNANGTVAVPNGQNGVWIGNGATNNTIGGTASASDSSGGRNVISGNTWAGVAIFHSGTNNNEVWNNYIGTNATGTAALGNNEGVYVAQGARFNRIGSLIKDNIISGNRNEGVVLRDAGTSNNTVLGNYIGTNAFGTAAVPNQKDGVWIGNGARDNTIGGTTVEARNLLSGNNWSGVALFHSGTTGNAVQGNYIGTNFRGDAPLGNGAGVWLNQGAHNNVIGGSSAGAGNVIAANHQQGVMLRDVGTSNNVVQGNFIGTNAAGTAALGNSQDGVRIALGASGNTIGGSLVGQGNTIAFNGNNGIGTVAAGQRNLLRGNAIYENGALGIDIDSDGVTFAHTVWLTGASSSGTDTTVEGWVLGAPNATYEVELFASAAADPSGFGEGEAPLPGLHTVSTDADGYGYLLVTLPFPLDGSCVSATATEADGTTGEFGNCLAVVPSGESLGGPGGAAARALNPAGASFPPPLSLPTSTPDAAPPALPPSREPLGAEGPTLGADGASFRDHRPDGAAVDAFFGGGEPLSSEAPLRRTAAVLPGEGNSRFWEWVFAFDES